MQLLNIYLFNICNVLSYLKITFSKLHIISAAEYKMMDKKDNVYY